MVPVARGLADILKRLEAGVITEVEARALSDGLIRGEVVPPIGDEPIADDDGVGEAPGQVLLPDSIPALPEDADVATVIDLLTALLGKSPALWTAADAQGFLGRGLTAIGEIIMAVAFSGADGLLASQMLQDFLSTLSVADDTPGLDDFDPATTEQTIIALYGALGIPVPTRIRPDNFQRSQGALRFPNAVGAADLFGLLGIQQSIVMDATSGQIFAIIDGVLTPLTAPGSNTVAEVAELYGIQPTDIVAMNPAQLADFGQQAAQAAPLEGADAQFVSSVMALIESGNLGQLTSQIDEMVAISPQAAQILANLLQGTIDADTAVSMLLDVIEGTSQVAPIRNRQELLNSINAPIDQGFPQQRFALIDPNSGIPLPDPRKIAAVWGRLSVADQDILVQVYRLAGYGGPGASDDAVRSALNNSLDFFTPEGSFSGAQIAGIG